MHAAHSGIVGERRRLPFGVRLRQRTAGLVVAEDPVARVGVPLLPQPPERTVAVLSVAFQFGEGQPGDSRVVLPTPQAAIMKSLVEGSMSSSRWPGRRRPLVASSAGSRLCAAPSNCYRL